MMSLNLSHFAGPVVFGPLLPEFFLKLYKLGHQNQAFFEGYPIVTRDRHILFVEKPLYPKKRKKRQVQTNKFVRGSEFSLIFWHDTPEDCFLAPL
jgi:hypothetical protein